MKKTDRLLWLMAVCSLVFLGAALVTLRAAEKAGTPAVTVPEESATIFDDPTLAPDARQSADHDVSFPADI